MAAPRTRQAPTRPLRQRQACAAHAGCDWHGGYDCRGPGPGRSSSDSDSSPATRFNPAPVHSRHASRWPRRFAAHRHRAEGDDPASWCGLVSAGDPPLSLRWSGPSDTSWARARGVRRERLVHWPSSAWQDRPPALVSSQPHRAYAVVQGPASTRPPLVDRIHRDRPSAPELGRRQAGRPCRRQRVGTRASRATRARKIASTRRVTSTRCAHRHPRAANPRRRTSPRERSSCAAHRHHERWPHGPHPATRKTPHPAPLTPAPFSHAVVVPAT